MQLGRRLAFRNFLIKVGLGILGWVVLVAVGLAMKLQVDAFVFVVVMGLVLLNYVHFFGWFPTERVTDKVQTLRNVKRYSVFAAAVFVAGIVVVLGNRFIW